MLDLLQMEQDDGDNDDNEQRRPAQVGVISHFKPTTAVANT